MCLRTAPEIPCAWILPLRSRGIGISGFFTLPPRQSGILQLPSCNRRGNRSHQTVLQGSNVHGWMCHKSLRWRHHGYGGQHMFSCLCWGCMGGTAGRMPLHHRPTWLVNTSSRYNGFQFQDPADILLVVVLLCREERPSPLCILNQVVPVLVLLQEDTSYMSTYRIPILGSPHLDVDL